MALKPCRECNKKVSTEATSCPSCGVPKPTIKKKETKKKSDDIYEDIWLYVKPAHDLVVTTFDYAKSQLDTDSAMRIFSITGYFKRGIFEASCVHYKLNKEDFKKAVIYCFRRAYDNEDYNHISAEKKDSFANSTYQSMEDGLRYDNSTGKMCKRIIASGKKSFKSDGEGCFSAVTKLWKDQSINFTDSPIKRDVKSFFKKLF